MSSNFLFDGSKESKNMLKLFVLYSDEEFKISPPSYLADFFISEDKSEPIGDLKSLDKYEKQLENVIDFVSNNTISQLKNDDFKLMNRFVDEYVEFFKKSPEHEDSALETGEYGLTYMNLIAPQFLDVFKEQIDEIRLNTFKYMLSVNNAFAITSVMEPQDNIIVTEKSRNIIEQFNCNNAIIYNLSKPLNRATAILLPNYSQLSLTDTMELKLKAEDEIDEMTYYLASSLYDFDGDIEKFEISLRNKVEPAIRQIEAKIKSLRYNTAQKALRELRNPMSYTPLVLSLIPDIPKAGAVLASVALVTSEVVLDYLKNKNAIKAEPLYCIYRLRKMGKVKS